MNEMARFPLRSAPRGFPQGLCHPEGTDGRLSLAATNNPLGLIDIEGFDPFWAVTTICRYRRGQPPPRSLPQWRPRQHAGAQGHRPAGAQSDRRQPASDADTAANGCAGPSAISPDHAAMVCAAKRCDARRSRSHDRPRAHRRHGRAGRGMRLRARRGAALSVARHDGRCSGCRRRTRRICSASSRNYSAVRTRHRRAPAGPAAIRRGMPASAGCRHGF